MKDIKQNKNELTEGSVVYYYVDGLQENKALVYLPRENFLVLRRFDRNEGNAVVVRSIASKLSDIDFVAGNRILMHRNYIGIEDHLVDTAEFSRYYEKLREAGLEIPQQKSESRQAKIKNYRERILSVGNNKSGSSPRFNLRRDPQGSSLVAPIGGYA